MFRLTAVLLAGLYVTMLIWGEAPDDDVVVARNETSSPAVPALGAAVASEPEDEPEDLSGLDAREALDAALEAGRSDAPEEPDAATPAAVEVPAEEEADEAETGSDLWYVTGTGVNLRSGPSSSAAVVGGVTVGDRAEVLSDPEASWIRIRTERGLEAWIFARFLSETPA